MTISIDKNIPIPAASRGRDSKYPWSAMEVGDSFFVEGKRFRQLSGAVNNAKKTHGFLFQAKSEGTGTRIWRIG